MGGRTFRRAQNVDPIWFEVENRNGSMTRFDCNDEIPGGLIFEFAGGDDDDPVANTGAMRAAKDLFNEAIVADRLELFWDMAKNRNNPPGVIGVSMMMEIAGLLAEEYSARPTGASSDAGSHKTKTGSPSTAGASAGESTYSRPELTRPAL